MRKDAQSAVQDCWKWIRRTSPTIWKPAREIWSCLSLKEKCTILPELPQVFKLIPKNWCGSWVRPDSRIVGDLSADQVKEILKNNPSFLQSTPLSAIRKEKCKNSGHPNIDAGTGFCPQCYQKVMDMKNFFGETFKSAASRERWFGPELVGKNTDGFIVMVAEEFPRPESCIFPSHFKTNVLPEQPLLLPIAALVSRFGDKIQRTLPQNAIQLVAGRGK